MRWVYDVLFILQLMFGDPQAIADRDAGRSTVVCVQAPAAFLATGCEAANRPAEMPTEVIQ